MVLLICFHFVHRDCFYPALSGLSFYLLSFFPPLSTCSTPPLKVCILIMIALGIGPGRLDMTAPSPECGGTAIVPFPLHSSHFFFFSFSSSSSPAVLIPTSCELRSYRSTSGKPGRARKTWMGETEYIKVFPNRDSATFFLGIQVSADAPKAWWFLNGWRFGTPCDIQERYSRWRLLRMRFLIHFGGDGMMFAYRCCFLQVYVCKWS